jgi:Family of unknown function (DUF6152)
MTRLFMAVLATTGLAAVCSVGTAVAHHAFAAEFDRDTPVQMTGSVTEMKWSNPHAWIYIDVEDENGNVVNWAFETRAANNIIRLGWRPKDLPVGTILKVDGFQARNGSSTASLAGATFSDGRALFASP